MSQLGRPLKFTMERRAAILQDIADAIPYQLAAEANGICEETLYAWLRQGISDKSEGIDSAYVTFSEDIKKVERDRIKRHSNKISENVDRWQADAWMLERRWYKYYGANVPLKEMDERIKQIEEKARDLHHGQEA